jgi:uncharacterized protein DUF3309
VNTLVANHPRFSVGRDTPHRESSIPVLASLPKQRVQAREGFQKDKRGFSWLSNSKFKNMSLGTILVILLILMLVGAFPTWPHSKNWGFYPSGGLGLLVVILLILVLLKKI